jgi:uncharacterized protein involved in exopolysaccharide biosynthesis
MNSQLPDPEHIKKEVEESDLRFIDVFIIIRKHFRLVLSILFIILFITAFWTLWQKPVYESTAMFAIEEQTKPFSLIPTELVPELAQNVNNETELLKSRTLMVSVIQELWTSSKWGDLFLFGTKAYEPEGKRKLIRKIFTLGLWSSKPEYTAPYTEIISDSLLAETLNAMYANIAITNPRGSEIIRITYSSHDPDEAALIVNLIAENYRESDHEWTAGESLHLKEFLGKQLENLKRELFTVEETLKDFQEKEQIFGLEDEAGILMHELAAIETEYYSKLAEVNIARDRQRYLIDYLSEKDKTLTDRMVNSLNNQLLALRIEIASSEADIVRNSSLYGEDHEAVISTKKKIKKLKDNLIIQTKELLTQGMSVSDPLLFRQATIDTILALQGVIAGLEGAAQEYKKLVDQYSSLLFDLPNKSLGYIRLERELRVLSETYKFLRQKREEAQLNEASQISKIRIVDAGVAPFKKSRPKTILNLIIGFVLGMGLGGITALIKERFGGSNTA